MELLFALILSASPRDEAKVLLQEANLALRAGYLGHARALLEEATVVDHTFASVYRSLGITCARLGDGDAAVDAYRHYLWLSPAAEDYRVVSQIIADYVGD